MPRFFVRLHHAGWTASQLAAVRDAAERSGFDGLSLYDVPSRPALECWTTLAHLLGSSNRLVGVPLVLANPLRHPALTAKMAWDLNDLTGGRVVLGLGAGGAPEDLRAYGLPDAGLLTRLGQLHEALALTRWLFGGEPVDHRGPHYQVEGLQLGGAGPPPPILVGGHGARLLEIAARLADAVNVGFDLGPEDWRSLRERLGGIRRQSRPDAERLLLTHNASVRAGTGRGLEPHVAALRDLRAAGVDWFFCVFEDLPATDLLERFGREVLPAVRA